MHARLNPAEKRSSRPVVAAIVPAYNEESTIGPIVKTLVTSGVFRDVIVISDGSTDRTAERARENGASLVHQFPWNRGKGAAMIHGVTHTDADILFFCDGDLIGLTATHLRDLVEPVVTGRHAMAIGFWDRGPFMMNFIQFLPLISGQRCLRREIFEGVPDRYLQGYMVESALNYFCRSRNLSYTTVGLRGLRIRHKTQKVGWYKGFRGYIRMTGQILSAMVSVRLARIRGEF